MSAIDLSTPSGRTAHFIATRAMLKSRDAAGRSKFNAEDFDTGIRILARLMYCIDEPNGGLRGMSDTRRFARAKQLRIPNDALSDAIYSSSDWETEVRRCFDAADLGALGSKREEARAA